MSDAKTIKAWHWLGEDCRLQYGTKRLVKPGVKMHAKGKIALCANGMHASERIIDALNYAPGPVVCRVELGGTIARGSDKLAARWRRVEWMFDATEVLHRFTCKVAEKALKDADVTDERCYEAIRVKLRWLEGNATDKQLDAARDAARAAAWDAARDAAWAAAWAAARAAARAAAWAAARDAAWNSARAAAWAAAWAAARAAQNTMLTDMIEAEAKKRGLL